MLDELVWDGTNKRAFALDELRLDERVFHRQRSSAPR
jgi:hypothetical protein